MYVHEKSEQMECNMLRTFEHMMNHNTKPLYAIIKLQTKWHNCGKEKQQLKISETLSNETIILKCKYMLFTKKESFSKTREHEVYHST